MWDLARLKIMPGKSSCFSSSEFWAVDQKASSSRARSSPARRQAFWAMGERFWRNSWSVVHVLADEWMVFEEGGGGRWYHCAVIFLLR